MSISNINAVPYNTIQFINGVPILSITYINGSPVITPSSSLQYLLMGGSFSTYNAPFVNRIATINTSGDVVFNSFNIGAGFSGTPYDIKKQPDGKIVVVGAGTSYSGSTISRVARLNSNGTLDTTLNTGTLGNAARAIIPHPNNSNIIVGDFPSISGSTASRYIAKLMPSGGLDPTFDVGMGFQQQVYNAATQSDGKIIAVGEFTNYYQSNTCISRTTLSGSQNAGPGTTFNSGVGFSTTANTFATQSDGKIIAAGQFTTYSGSNATRIVRINTNGTVDSTFNSGVGFNSDVNQIKIQSDGKIIAVGAFNTYSGSTSTAVIRLNTNGTRDVTFNVGTGFSANMNQIQIQPDNKILIGGQATTYSGSTINYLTRLNTDGTIDPTFNTGTSFNVGGAVFGLVLQPDGKIVAGGSFTSYSGSSTNTTRLIRINSSGSQDTTFVTGTGFSNQVYAATLEPTTNKIIVAGNWTAYSGSVTNTARIIRINTDGTQDTTFVSGTGLQNFTVLPNHLSVESDGKIYVGNTFTTYSGSLVNNFVRINPSGTLDTTFEGYLPTSANSLGFNSNVRSILVSGSNIYFGGTFTAYQQTPYLVRINTDGTRDTTFQLGTGPSSPPYDVKVQPDDKIIVAGNFTTYSGSSATRIMRLNSNGTLDTSFSGTGFNSAVYSLDIQPDEKILAIGAFTTYNGATTNYITRINSNGTRDSSFNVGTSFSTVSAGANTMKILSIPNGKVMVTIPLVTSYSGSTSGNILRINSSGTLDTTFNPIYPNMFNRTGFGFSTTTGNPGGYTMFLTGSDVIVGGQFITYKAPVLQGGAMINSIGAISTSFNPGATGFNSIVYTYATQSNGKIIAAGAFSIYSGSTSTRIVRINTNGTLDTTFNVGAGANGIIYNVSVQSDDKVIATGLFTTYSGSANSGIVRINTDGTRDVTFNVGTGLTLSTQGQHSAIQPDGKVIVVGAFTIYSGSSVNRIVRINTNGTRDTSFNAGTTAFNSTPEAVIVQPDGKIISTGAFTAYSGSSTNRLVRINSNGTRDTTFNIGTGFSTSNGTALALQSDGKIICANLNTAYSGSTNRYIIRINPSGSLDTTFNANANSTLSQTSFTPNSLAIANDGKIYWGNSFTTFSGSFTPNRIVRLNISGSVDETFNQDYSNYINGLGKGADGTINAVLLL